MNSRTSVWCRAGALIALTLAGWCGASLLLLWGGAAPMAAVRMAGPAAAGLDDLVAAGAGLGAWAALSWLTLGVLISTLSAARGALGRASAPGALGRAGARLARVFAPALLRRLVAGMLGVAVLGATTGLAAAPAGAASGHPVAVQETAAGLPVGWTPDRPLHPANTPARAPATAHQPEAFAARAAARPAPVVVRPGDTLWAIAALALGEQASAAEVARSWPLWHDANRGVIGADPSLIRPGQALQPPG